MSFVAAVTNYQKRNGLENMNLLSYSSACQDSKISLMLLKSRYHKAVCLLEAPWENPFPGLFQRPEVACIP